MKTLYTLLILIVVASSSLDASTSLAILKGEDVGKGRARLLISMTDEQGRPIQGLTRENFRLSVEGDIIYPPADTTDEAEDFTLEPVISSENPLSTILGMDISGSMHGEPFYKTKEALAIFLVKLNDNDYIWLMRFGTDVTFSLTGFTQEKETAIEEMSEYQATDQETHLYDAIHQALKNSKKTKTLRTAIVFLTDGKDEGSAIHRSDLIPIIREASVPIFIIGFGKEIDRQSLQMIADESGGYFLHTPETDRIADLYETVLEQLNNQYYLNFNLGGNPGEYRVVLTLNYAGEEIETGKDIIIESQIEPTGPGFPWPWIIVACILIYVVAASVWYLKKRKTVAGPITIPEECEIQWPDNIEPTQLDLLRLDSDDEDDRTKVADSFLPKKYLKIDALANGLLPLEYDEHHGNDTVEELIIARRGGEEPLMKKEDAVYLWVLRNRAVSRVKDQPGHARIFLTRDGRYAIEDLESSNGTLVNSNEIREKSSYTLLQDNDTIEIGGATGIRMVYKERASMVRDDLTGLTRK